MGQRTRGRVRGFIEQEMNLMHIEPSAWRLTLHTYRFTQGYIYKLYTFAGIVEMSRQLCFVSRFDPFFVGFGTRKKQTRLRSICGYHITRQPHRTTPSPPLARHSALFAHSTHPQATLYIYIASHTTHLQHPGCGEEEGVLHHIKDTPPTPPQNRNPAHIPCTCRRDAFRRISPNPFEFMKQVQIMFRTFAFIAFVRDDTRENICNIYVRLYLSTFIHPPGDGP